MKGDKMIRTKRRKNRCRDPWILKLSDKMKEYDVYRSHKIYRERNLILFANVWKGISAENITIAYQNSGEIKQ